MSYEWVGKVVLFCCVSEYVSGCEWVVGLWIEGGG